MMDLLLSSTEFMRWGAVIGASLLAAVWDVRTGKIPNRLTGTLALLGLAFSLWRGGLPGLAEAGLTALFMAAPFVLLFIVGGGGAGDAKLMGALGAWLALRAGAVVLVAVAVTGGVLAMLRILAHRDRMRLLARLGTLLYVLMVGLYGGRRGLAPLMTGRDESEELKASGVTMPYGPAIFIGVCIAAIWVHT